MVDLALLKQVGLFRRVDADDLSRLGDLLVHRRYKAGQVIFHQGDPDTSFHIIASGRASISLISEDGQELVVASFGEGDFFGELALLDSQPRSATATAVTAVDTHTLRRDEFLAFLSATPSAAIAICVTLAERLRRTDERLADGTFLSMPQRLAKWILQMSELSGRESDEGLVVDIPYNQRELGEMIGASRQSVNKVLSQWEDSGFLRRDGRNLVLKRPEQLLNIFRPGI
ncbi:MAG: Crp/Fnr family transcriptional regulator [Dehalococcoidia bacterium]